MSRLILICLCLLPFTACDAPVAGSGGTSSNSRTETDVVSAPKDVGPPVKKDFASVAEALDILTSATKAGEKDQQREAYNWLCRQDEGAIPEVTAAVNDTSISVEVRRLACGALGKLGPQTAPTLIELSRSDEKLMQLKAIETMRLLKPPPPEVIERLIVLMDDADSNVQKAAVQSLGAIGERAKASAEKLIAMQNNPDLPEKLRDAAAAAVRKVQPRRTLLPTER